jgi:hypothetical protein
LEVGLRLAAAPGARGIGFEALVLIAHERRRVHLVLNAGAIADPPSDGRRPLGLEAGLDFAFDISHRWSLTSAVGAVYYLSPDASLIFLSAGVSYSPREWLSLSLSAVTGFLAGADLWGVLFGYSQKLSLH